MWKQPNLDDPEGTLGNYVLECWNCGKLFHSYSQRRRYCSYECKIQAWNERRKLFREVARVKTCEYCGKEFQAKRKDAKFCCDSHRVLAHLKKKKGIIA